jgi:hypothetical protein
MNKGPIAKCQNLRGQNKDAQFSRRNDVIPRTVHPLPPWNRGTRQQKKKKEWKVKWHLLRPINTVKSIHSVTVFLRRHNAPLTLRKPSPTVQQWRDCWCVLIPPNTESILSLHEDYDPRKIRIKFPSRSPIKSEVEGRQNRGWKENKTETKEEREEKLGRKRTKRTQRTT